MFSHFISFRAPAFDHHTEKMLPLTGPHTYYSLGPMYQDVDTALLALSMVFPLIIVLCVLLTVWTSSKCLGPEDDDENEEDGSEEGDQFVDTKSSLDWSGQTVCSRAIFLFLFTPAAPVQVIYQ
jgi:hypothetical protein